MTSIGWTLLALLSLGASLTVPIVAALLFLLPGDASQRPSCRRASLTVLAIFLMIVLGLSTLLPSQ